MRPNHSSIRGWFMASWKPPSQAARLSTSTSVTTVKNGPLTSVRMRKRGAVSPPSCIRVLNSWKSATNSSPQPYLAWKTWRATTIDDLRVCDACERPEMTERFWACLAPFDHVALETGHPGQHVVLCLGSDPKGLQRGCRVPHDRVVLASADAEPLMQRLHVTAGVDGRAARRGG